MKISLEEDLDALLVPEEPPPEVPSEESIPPSPPPAPELEEMELTEEDLPEPEPPAPAPAVDSYVEAQGDVQRFVKELQTIHLERARLLSREREILGALGGALVRGNRSPLNQRAVNPSVGDLDLDAILQRALPRSRPGAELDLDRILSNIPAPAPARPRPPQRPGPPAQALRPTDLILPEHQQE